MRLRHLLLLSCVLASGCAGLRSWETPPQREMHNQTLPARPARAAGPDEYAVVAGDTMYSIAFRNNLDYRELARWNSVGSDYLIFPGQILSLKAPGPASYTVGDVTSHADETPEAPPLRPQVLPTQRMGVVPGAGPEVPRLPPPPPLPPVATLPGPPAASDVAAVNLWVWPTNGVVVRGYNPAAGSKGLDFSGTLGQPVFAAAAGKVVYSGSALKGYGELIIIKHDDLRLSAYGYNRTRLVKDGETVRAGQQIAELGLGPESRPVLHFEIRERGQPVNPVPYLPARAPR